MYVGRLSWVLSCLIIGFAYLYPHTAHSEVSSVVLDTVYGVREFSPQLDKMDFVDELAAQPGQYYLAITNGSGDQIETRSCDFFSWKNIPCKVANWVAEARLYFERVERLEIHVNGERVVWDKNFDQKSGMVVVPVSLKDHNTLLVRMKGRVTASLKVRVFGSPAESKLAKLDR